MMPMAARAPARCLRHPLAQLRPAPHREGTDGPLAGYRITRDLDAGDRLQGHTLSRAVGAVGAVGAGAALYAQDYYYTDRSGYETGRLRAIGSGGLLARYHYADSLQVAQVEQVDISRAGVPRFQRRMDYDRLQRHPHRCQPSTTHARSAPPMATRLNQRIQRTDQAGRSTHYQYDALERWTSRAYFADSSAQPGRAFDYDFDHIGNRAHPPQRHDCGLPPTPQA